MTQSVKVVGQDSSESSSRPILVHLSLWARWAHSGNRVHLTRSVLRACLACSILRVCLGHRDRSGLQAVWPVRVLGPAWLVRVFRPTGPFESSGLPSSFGSSGPLGPFRSLGPLDPFWSSGSPEFSGSLGPISGGS